MSARIVKEARGDGSSIFFFIFWKVVNYFFSIGTVPVKYVIFVKTYVKLYWLRYSNLMNFTAYDYYLTDCCDSLILI